MDELGTRDGEARQPESLAADDPTAPIPTLTGSIPEPATAIADDATQPIERASAPAFVPAPVVDRPPDAPNGAGADRTRLAVSRRRRIGATVGIVVCAILIVVAVLGRFYAVGKVDELAARVDTGLQRGVTLVETASGRVQPVADAASTVVDAAQAAAASPSGPIGSIVGVLGDVTGLGERYRQFRTAYDDARQVVLGAFERLNTIDALIPQIQIPVRPRGGVPGARREDPVARSGVHRPGRSLAGRRLHERRRDQDRREGTGRGIGCRWDRRRAR